MRGTDQQQNHGFSYLSPEARIPEGVLDDDCTASTSLSAEDACSLTIEFSPVTPLGSKSSAVLSEAVNLTTDSLNAQRWSRSRSAARNYRSSSSVVVRGREHDDRLSCAIEAMNSSHAVALT
jgi:hypothetical protein